MEKYADRYEAGRLLAEQLQSYSHREDVIVLALPRGGVPVAYEIAKALSVPLDILIVRKLGTPGQEELAMGAITSGSVSVFNEEIIHTLHISKNTIEKVIQSEKKELERREESYRGNRPFPNLFHKTIILVDDGIATGATMRAAIKALRQKNPANIIISVPVAALSTCNEIARLADKIICPLKTEFFYAVGAWYENFSQTEDSEVLALLNKYPF